MTAPTRPAIAAHFLTLELNPERIVRAALVADWPKLAGGDDKETLLDFMVKLPTTNDLMAHYRVNEKYIALVFMPGEPHSEVEKAVAAIAEALGANLERHTVSAVPFAAQLRVVYDGPGYRGIAPHTWMMEALAEAFDLTI